MFKRVLQGHQVEMDLAELRDDVFKEHVPERPPVPARLLVGLLAKVLRRGEIRQDFGVHLLKRLANCRVPFIQKLGELQHRALHCVHERLLGESRGRLALEDQVNQCDGGECKGKHVELVVRRCLDAVQLVRADVRLALRDQDGAAEDAQEDPDRLELVRVEVHEVGAPLEEEEGEGLEDPDVAFVQGDVEHVAHERAQHRPLDPPQVPHQGRPGLVGEHEGHEAWHGRVEVEQVHAQKERQHHGREAAPDKGHVHLVEELAPVEQRAQRVDELVSGRRLVQALEHAPGEVEDQGRNPGDLARDEALHANLAVGKPGLAQHRVPPHLVPALRQRPHRGLHALHPLLYGHRLLLAHNAILHSKRGHHEQLAGLGDQRLQRVDDRVDHLGVDLAEVLALGADLQDAEAPVHLLHQLRVSAQRRSPLSREADVEALPPGHRRGSLHHGHLLPVRHQLGAELVDGEVRLRAAVVLRHVQQEVRRVLRRLAGQRPGRAVGRQGEGEQHGEERQARASQLHHEEPGQLAVPLEGHEGFERRVGDQQLHQEDRRPADGEDPHLHRKVQEEHQEGEDAEQADADDRVFVPVHAGNVCDDVRVDAGEKGSTGNLGDEHDRRGHVVVDGKEDGRHDGAKLLNPRLRHRYPEQFSADLRNEPRDSAHEGDPARQADALLEPRPHVLEVAVRVLAEGDLLDQDRVQLHRPVLELLGSEG
mmetsp:Transcript_11884/g.31398  ORF Transcript_11884/g.31398 Transcript_11884/m.31398 type:complete len:707 (-) Transcript_11884:189-2309(-)